MSEYGNRGVPASDSDGLGSTGESFELVDVLSRAVCSVAEDPNFDLGGSLVEASDLWPRASSEFERLARPKAPSQFLVARGCVPRGDSELLAVGVSRAVCDASGWPNTAKAPSPMACPPPLSCLGGKSAGAPVIAAIPKLLSAIGKASSSGEPAIAAVSFGRGSNRAGRCHQCGSRYHTVEACPGGSGVGEVVPDAVARARVAEVEGSQSASGYSRVGTPSRSPNLVAHSVGPSAALGRSDFPCSTPGCQRRVEFAGAICEYCVYGVGSISGGASAVVKARPVGEFKRLPKVGVPSRASSIFWAVAGLRTADALDTGLVRGVYECTWSCLSVHLDRRPVSEIGIDVKYFDSLAGAVDYVVREQVWPRACGRAGFRYSASDVPFFDLAECRRKELEKRAELGQTHLQQSRWVSVRAASIRDFA